MVADFKHTSVMQHTVRMALQANRCCDIPTRLLRTQRSVYLDRGPLSHGNAQELLVLVSEERGYWYGHVLKLAPEQLRGDRERAWVAILVLAGREIDGSTPEEVLNRARDTLRVWCEYEPCYAQSPDDTFSLEVSFEAASAALARIIERFDPALRTETCFDEYGFDNRPPPGNLDLRCIDVYGMSCDALREEEERRPHR